jgi:hypothetical protein
MRRGKYWEKTPFYCHSSTTNTTEMYFFFITYMTKANKCSEKLLPSKLNMYAATI